MVVGPGFGASHIETRSSVGPVTDLDGLDLTSPDLYAERVPLEEFALLRRTAPVWWNAQTVEGSGFSDGGFWVLSRHADVKEVSCAREGWSAAENGSIVAFEGQRIEDSIDMQRLLLLNMDPPHHTEVRGVINKGCFGVLLLVAAGLAAVAWHFV